MFFNKNLQQIFIDKKFLADNNNKQLKQNFPLHFFLGDSENAIKIQVWVTLIANLLCTVIKQMIKRRCAFSQVVTMIRLTLMYSTSILWILWKILIKIGKKSSQSMNLNHPQMLRNFYSIFKRGGLVF